MTVIGCPSASSSNRSRDAQTSALSWETKIGRSPKISTPLSAAYARSSAHWVSNTHWSNRSACTSPGVDDLRDALRVPVTQARLPGRPRLVAEGVAQRHELDVWLEPVAVLRAPVLEVSLLRLGELVRVGQASLGAELTADQLGTAGHRRERVVRRPVGLVRRHQRKHLPDRAAGRREEVDEPVGLRTEVAGPGIAGSTGRGQRGDVQQHPRAAYVQRTLVCGLPRDLRASRPRGEPRGGRSAPGSAVPQQGGEAERAAGCVRRAPEAAVCGRERLVLPGVLVRAGRRRCAGRARAAPPSARSRWPARTPRPRSDGLRRTPRRARGSSRPTWCASVARRSSRRSRPADGRRSHASAAAAWPARSSVPAAAPASR